MWRCVDVEVCRCGDVDMWRCVDLEMWMWRYGCGNVDVEM